MSKKVYLMSLIAVFACTAAFAQKDKMKKKATTAATTQTVGYTTKPATPHQWEVGVGLGTAVLYGDVQVKPGFGISGHIRRAVDHIFAIRGEGQITRLTGLEPRSSGAASIQPTAAAGVLNKYYATGKWFPNFQTTAFTGQAQLVISLNRFRFSRTDSKFNPYVYVGVGANIYNQNYNALNGTTKYNFNAINDVNTLNGGASTRTQVKKDVQALLDGTYETSGSDGGTGRTKINPLASGGGGISYKVNNKINVGVDMQAYLLLGNQNDDMDGYNGGSNRDFHFYPSLRLNLNIGGPAGATEPLYWVNPLAETLAEIDEIAARPKLDLTDADGDGVVDMWDQDKTTPAGARVDTKGMPLDSDGDGVPDYKDKEPYSPAGYLDRVDKSTGIADVPKEPVLTEADVNRIVDGKIAGLKTALDASIASSTGKNAAIVDWFLPIIHFDFDRYNVRTSEFDKLYQVANVMKQNPGINVLVSGHADKVSGNKYNSVLSFNRAQAAIDHLVGKYGIERSRLVLNYGGEETNLVKTAKESIMNRRVEFSVAKGESDMGRPAGPKAGKGNKSAGY
jgi:OmpA-OmpF porin, OOP family